MDYDKITFKDHVETVPSAKIIADSVSPEGFRLTTFEVEFHRFILSEFNTHRLFSRNSASSRAIPVRKQLDRVNPDPAFPVKWPAEGAGMQGGEELAGWDLAMAQDVFANFKYNTVELIEDYLNDVSKECGISWDDPDPDKIKELKSHTLHKSLLNRLIEPIMWHKVIVTSTDYSNFYEQRVSKLAQPEIEVVAAAMQALMGSEPVELQRGQWHLPYVTLEERVALGWEQAKKVSAARCARVSYLTHSGIRDFSEDFKLFEKLTQAYPPHWSPLEHIATPDSSNFVSVRDSGGNFIYNTSIIGNFTGWEQMRHEGETWR